MGTAGRDVRTIAKQVAALIRERQKDLSLTDLMEVSGMGLAKAAQILSAFELARRHLIKEVIKITRSQDILPLVSDLADKRQEHFICISLNGANEVIEKRIVTIGLLNMSPVHPPRSLRRCMVDRAASVIFVHNHPSGDLQPSNTDLRMHEQLTEAGKILGLRVLDHIIVAKKGHFSFQDAGLIKG